MSRIFWFDHGRRCAGLVLVGASLAASAHGVISGIPDSNNDYSAVARLGGINCSAVLVARRVALTSAHCLARFATQCFSYSSGNLQVRFAEPDGTVNFIEPDATVNCNKPNERTINVQSIEVHHDAAVNVSQCNTGDPCAGDNLDCSEFNSTTCFDPADAEAPQSINRSSEIVVLFLADEAPSDVTPMKILVHPTFKNSSNRFVSFADLESWALQEQPLITAVGFGTGSQNYVCGATTLTGRDRGVLRWKQTESLYGGTLGWDNCTTKAPSVQTPGSVVSPDDITNDDAPTAMGSGPAWCSAVPGSDIAGANQSYVSCGDSGGPLVVGAGPSSKGVSPTPLPAPASGDTYSSNGHYVAGTASAYVANIGDHPATVYNPTWTLSASSFLTAHLFDSDGDGLVNKLDEFPGCNDYGPDQDGDGIPNECDPCPCDPNDTDADGDGLCVTECYGPGDNCAEVFNPGQENCNLVSEMEHTPSAIFGDHCDPVPCPEAHVRDKLLEENVIDYSFGGYHNKIWWRCSTYAHNELGVRPLRSHPATGVNASSAMVPDVPTHVRFCQRDPSRGIFCDEPFDLEDARLSDSDCAPPATCPSPETIDTHWHRMTFTQGGNGGDPNGAPASPDYNFAAGGTGGFKWTWNYAADWQRWTQEGLIDNAATPQSLDGALWLHAEIEVGNTDLSLGTGFHGDQLANRHILQYEPESLRCSVGTSIRAIQTPFFLFLTLPDPGPDDYRRWDAVLGETSFVVQTGVRDWGALTSFGDAEIVTDRMAPELRGLLRDRSLVWANAVEPFRHQGGLSLPTAVALSADGSDLVGGIEQVGGRLEAAAGIASRSGSPQAVGFVPVYTKVRRGVFVIGGNNPKTRRPTGEVWFTPIRGTTWRRIRTEVEPERVLAATYSSADDSLYVLDHTREGQARLWIHGITTGKSKVLGQWKRHPAWNRHWLVIDTDGSVLLASSNTRERRHAIAHITTSREKNPTAPKVDGIARGRRVLLLPPLADGAGYTLVKAGVPGWPEEAVAGVRGVRVGRGSRIEGDVAVIEGATRGELVVDPAARIEGYVAANRVRVAAGGEIAGGLVRTNRLDAPGSIEAKVVKYLKLPLPLELPRLSEIRVSDRPVIVESGGTTKLPPGEYGRILLQSGSRGRPTVLRLTGGRYTARSVDLGRNAVVVCDAPCDVSIRSRLKTGADSRIGSDAEGLPAAQVRIIVAGGDAILGVKNRLRVRLFVPRGKLVIGDGSVARGTFVGREVSLGARVEVVKDEGAVVFDRRESLDLEPATLADLGAQL